MNIIKNFNFNLSNIILEVLVNLIILFFLINSFINIDLLKTSQMVLLSVLVSNVYIINKKVLRNRKKDKNCKVKWSPILIGFGFGIVNFLFLLLLKKIF